MNNLRPRAARRAIGLFLVLTALAACTDMGSGADPKETEGTFLLSLPLELKPSEIKPKAAEDSPESEEQVISDEGEAPPADKEEPPQEDAELGISDEPAVALAPLPDKAEPTDSSPAESASTTEAGALAAESDAPADLLPDNVEPLEEGIVVSRYFLSMVSALGFSQYEEIEPSEEQVKLISQAGHWKIVAIAEGPDGEAIASCELKGVALSAGEEKAVDLEWEAP